MKHPARKFEPILPFLQCPKCKGAFSVSENSLLCSSGHRYDLAAKGYLNVAPNADPSRYDRKLFESRRRILTGELYREVIDAISAHGDAFMPHAKLVADAGCGEGSFLMQCSSAQHRVGFDLSKDAIRMASSGGNPLPWLVADLTSMPFRDGSVDILYNILSPAHYAEFSRVLSKDGILIKVVPNGGYLKEIRAIAKENNVYSNEKVIKHLAEHFSIVKTEVIQKTHPITDAQAQDFLRMTPLMFGLDPTKMNAGELHSMTIDVTVVTARKQ